MPGYAQIRKSNTERRARPRAVGWWLLSCCAVLLTLVMVGGATRLTESGLSIVDWKPVTGVMPPIGEAAWQAEFSRYQSSPQYTEVNHGMALGDFKTIFWFEFFHRLLARLLGLWFALPLLWFWLRGAIPSRLRWPLLGILALGAAQGYMGWYMVKSGLVDDPRVSQYRLTAHLSLAFLIFIAMMWVALGLWSARARTTADAALRGLQRTGFWLAVLAFYMVVTGGFVAGIRAGKAYNTFPLMNGHVLPPESFILDPWYLNLFNNMALVQFDHRAGAWLLALVVPWFWVRSRAPVVSVRARSVASLLLVAVAAQIALGIVTLLAAVPVALGAAHQGGAMVVFGILLWVNHELRVARDPGMG